MKKVLSVLVALMMGATSFAQTWEHIAAPFTATDIYGHTVNLADTLAAGKAVVIDYSCCWCGPCWNLHTSGILEAIQEQMDEVCVIWVETESSNDLSEIQGNSTYPNPSTNDQYYSGYTQGNWTLTPGGDSVPYPIIDNSSCLNTCAALYAGSVPSVFLIDTTGFFCSIYGPDYGIANNAALTISNIRELLANAPKHGQLPVVDIRGEAQIAKGHILALQAHVTSVDEVTNYEWSHPGATLEEQDGDMVYLSWENPGTYTVTVTVTNVNGSSEASIEVTVLDHIFYCGFDDELEMSNWNYVDRDGDGYNWALASDINASAYAHSGADAAIGFSYMNNTALSPDNWMITPAITLPNITTLRAEWYDRGFSSQYADKYSVYIDTIDGSVEHFLATSAKFTRTVSNTSWTHRQINLGNYAGKTIYIAFRHWNSTDKYIFSIDDLRVYNTNPTVGIDDVADINVALYPNPVNDQLRVDVDGLREVNVMDLSGRVLMTVNSNLVDMSAMASGVYYVRVVTADGVATKKIVKQ